MAAKRFLLILILLLAAALPSVHAQDVDVGLYVLNLGKFDVATGSFTADFYISFKCKRTCNVDDFEFMNGKAVSIDKIEDSPKEKFYRVQANLNSQVDLKRFPFDSQKMQIIIEDKKNTIDKIKYIPLKDESGIDSSIAFTGWNIEGWNSESKEHYYKVYNETYSQSVFSIDISRIALNSFMKTFLPVIFIVLIVVSTFVLDPDKVTTRMTVASSSLIAAVMFHISISNQIPPVGYLTFADKFMVMTYFILLASFIINIILLELQELKKMELVEKVHRSTEYSMFAVVPVLYIILFVFFV